MNTYKNGKISNKQLKDALQGPRKEETKQSKT